MAVEPASTETLIAGLFTVDPARPVPDAGAGLPALAASNRKTGDTHLVGLAVGRHASPRLAAIQALTAPIDNLMTPLGHGVGPKSGGGQAYYVICPAPPGPPLSSIQDPWPESQILEHVLRPIAQALIGLQEFGLTHRAIRRDNVFMGARNQPVTLGSAWAAPPAMLQPSVYESPFSAVCHPAGRGDGTIADDVYALGVLLIVLATGRVPMANLDDLTVIRRKLELGSYHALTEGLAIPPFLSDLLRGMLADETEHRPAPRLLTDMNNARIRRIASRPPRRSQRPLPLNDMAVFDSRTLALALATDEKRAIRALRHGLVSNWLRRGLGDAGLASQVEDLIRIRLADRSNASHADALLLMHAVSTIEPRMPLCWRGTALWPDAIGSLLAAGVRGDPSLLTLSEEIIRNDILPAWSVAGARPAHDDLLSLSAEGRQHRIYLQKDGEGALLRFFYALNPALPCGMQAMADLWIIDIPDLMRFLERAASSGPNAVLLEVHIRAFIAARAERQFDSSVNRLIATKEPALYRKRQIGLLRDLQQRYHVQPMPGLAAWAAAQLRPELDMWRNRPRRAALIERLEVLAKAGFISRVLALAEDGKARAEDETGARRAALMVAAIDEELAVLERSGNTRRTVMARFGREIAAAAGMSALVLMALLAAFE